MVKGLAEYSNPCNVVKDTASPIDINKPSKKYHLFACIIEWWASVILTPEDNNNIVFSKGSSKGSIACIPKGGHCIPNSTVGDKEL